MNFVQSFFKFIFSSEKMDIPRAVVLEMQGKSAILRDCCGNLWAVEVESDGDRCCFKKGWPQFYQDCSLEPRNLLVFEYKGENLFDFKLFGANGCEKRGAGAPKFRVKEEDEDLNEEYDDDDDDDHYYLQEGAPNFPGAEEVEGYNADEDLKEGTGGYSDDEDDGDGDDDEDEDEDEDEDYVQDEEESEEEEQVKISKKTKCENQSESFVAVKNSQIKRKCSEGNVAETKGIKALKLKVREEEVEDEREKEESTDGEDDEDENDEHEMDIATEDGYDDEEQSNSSKAKSTSSGSLKSSSRQDIPTLGIGTLPSRRNYQKKNVLDCYGADIFKAGLAIRPSNRPFFVSRSRTPRRNELYIPKDVIVDYNLEIPEELYLADERGRQWKTKVKQWKDGRLWCTKGWRSLCHVNNIDKEDACICEFVKQGCKDMHILVRPVDGAGGPRQPPV